MAQIAFFIFLTNLTYHSFSMSNSMCVLMTLSLGPGSGHLHEDER